MVTVTSRFGVLAIRLLHVSVMSSDKSRFAIKRSPQASLDLPIHLYRALQRVRWSLPQNSFENENLLNQVTLPIMGIDPRFF